MKIRKRMSEDELRRELDYQVGDIIQIRPDGQEDSGRLGVIIGLSIYRQKPGRPDAFSYRIKLSDQEGISAPCHRIRLVRKAESNEVLPENKSQFLPVRANLNTDDETAE